VGQTIILNKRRFTVIGIMPEGFRGAWPGGMAPEVWVPVTMQPSLQPEAGRFGDRGDHWLQLVGRLKPGVSQAQAQAAVSLVTRRLAESYPGENRGLENAVVYPMGNLPEPFTRVIPVIVGVVTLIAGMVLLLVCANIANLLLARAATRRQEMAIRLALGAHPRRLIRQLLTESLLLAFTGAAAGCLLAVWLTNIMRSSRLPMTPIELNAALDARALLFTLAISALSGALFGLAPAWHASKFDLVPMLKDDQRVGGGRPARFRLRNLLVISQVAVSLVFLICAGLFMRSLRQANNVDPGFETGRVLTVPLDLSSAGYDEARGRLFYRQILDEVERTPGAQAAALAEGVPLKDGWGRYTVVAVEGHDSPGGDRPGMRFNTVGPRYFETMGIPVLAGREFNPKDGEGAPFVAVVNETMARRFWPGQSPLGRRLRFIQENDALGPYYEVVGMVKDSKYRSLGEGPQPFFFVSAAQNYRRRMTLHLRTAVEPSSLRSAVRDRIVTMDKDLLVEVSTMRENVVDAFFPARVATAALGLIGLFGLSLALVGIYGVISYAVSQRTGEIGLRMALGAESRDILRLVIGQGLKLTLIGVVSGTMLSLAVTRLLTGMLAGVSAADPLTFFAVPLLLTTVAFFACWIPARRATKVDPMTALRRE
jgi:predicted permease